MMIGGAAVPHVLYLDTLGPENKTLITPSGSTICLLLVTYAGCVRCPTHSRDGHAQSQCCRKVAVMVC